jgi:hypothetical protein
MKPVTALVAVLTICVGACDTQPAATAPGVSDAATPPAAAAALQRTPSPAGARVFFITPADGETVSNPVKIEFGIEGMAVARAGTEQPDSGHHHLLIDAGLPALDLPIPADANYIHFGDGSTSTEISLSPGSHTLRMLLGDYRHVPHDPPVTSDIITITVQ